jgi:hypothetical protein
MKIKIAESFLNEHHQISHFFCDKFAGMVVPSDKLEQAMIEFARYHVDLALKAATKNADLIETDGDIDPETILNAYDLNNIK